MAKSGIKIHGTFGDLGVAIRVRRFKRRAEAPALEKVYDGTEHGHDFTEIIIGLSGHGVHRVDGRDYPVAAGDVFVVQGEQTHALLRRDNLEWLEVHYNPQRFAMPTDLLLRLPGYHALFVLEPKRRGRGKFEGRLRLRSTRLAEVNQIAATMEDELHRKSDGYEAVLVGRLILLLTLLSREYSKAPTGEAHALLRVGEVVSLLEREYERNWRLSELCRLAHMSRSNLLVVFREATGQTPIEYLIHVRLREAMLQLRTTDRPVTEIAFAVGFGDSNYFTRQFRRAVGMSPREYRRSVV